MFYIVALLINTLCVISFTKYRLFGETGTVFSSYDNGSTTSLLNIIFTRQISFDMMFVKIYTML